MALEEERCIWLMLGKCEELFSYFPCGLQFCPIHREDREPLQDWEELHRVSDLLAELARPRVDAPYFGGRTALGRHQRRTECGL